MKNRIKSILDLLDEKWNPKKTFVPVLSLSLLTILSISFQSFTTTDSRVAKRVVTFTTQERITTEFDCANLSEVPSLELLGAQEQVINKTVEISFDQRNTATITTTIHDRPQYENDLSNLITKSVTQGGLTTLYDLNGRAIPNPNPGMRESEVQMTLTDAELSSFGISQPVRAISPAELSQLQRIEGIAVSSREDGSTTIRKGNIEISANPSTHSIESRQLDGRGNVQNSVMTFYSTMNGTMSFPSTKIEKKNELTSNGIPKTITTLTTTSQYSVVENGRAVLNFNQSERR